MWRSGHIDQRNSTENPETVACKYAQPDFNKGANQPIKGRSVQLMLLEQLNMHRPKGGRKGGREGGREGGGNLNLILYA